jgi:hypothetical protein
LGGFDVSNSGGCRRNHYLAGRLREIVAVDRLEQLALAACADGYCFNDGDAEHLLQGCPVDLVAALLGDVAHVQGDQHRAANPLELEDEPEVQPQIGGIDDADEEVRRLLRGMATQNHVPGDSLVQARGFETIGSREVDEPVGPPGAGSDESPLLALYSDSRVVSDLLAAAREAIEEGRLAAVRDPDER